MRREGPSSSSSRDDVSDIAESATSWERDLREAHTHKEREARVAILHQYSQLEGKMTHSYTNAPCIKVNTYIHIHTYVLVKLYTRKPS